MTNEQEVRRSAEGPRVDVGDEIFSTAILAGALQPGDEPPSEANLVRPRAEETRSDAGSDSPRPASAPQPRAAEQQPSAPAPEQPAAATGTRQPAAASPDAVGGQAPPSEEQAPLFAPETADGYRQRWRDVQTNFVDDPRGAVNQADRLVAHLLQELANTFAAERSALERQWDNGTEVSTEDLRIAMRRYRSFFSRLLSL